MLYELCYQRSFDRLFKLQISSIYKIYRNIVIARKISLYTIFLIPGALIGFFAKYFITMPILLPLVVILLLWVIGINQYIFTSLLKRRMRDRVGSEVPIRLVADSDGLRFIRNRSEYYLEWDGIDEIWMEKDGIVISANNCFNLIPDAAFENETEKLAFLRNVFDRINDVAQSRTRRYLKNTLSIAHTTQ